KHSFSLFYSTISTSKQWTTGKKERKPVAQGGGYSNYNRSVFFKTTTAARYETTIKATQESSKNAFIMVFLQRI
ncbi:MAG: hypothetical protein U9P36_07070, partial [Thermodesulfobacteriota bacterium]|nr:hypothetical protein [Thermodesulfobacteriota bacterium]